MVEPIRNPARHTRLCDPASTVWYRALGENAVQIEEVLMAAPYAIVQADTDS